MESTDMHIEKTGTGLRTGVSEITLYTLLTSRGPSPDMDDFLHPDSGPARLRSSALQHTEFLVHSCASPCSESMCLQSWWQWSEALPAQGPPACSPSILKSCPPMLRLVSHTWSCVPADPTSARLLCILQTRHCCPGRNPYSQCTSQGRLKSRSGIRIWLPASLGAGTSQSGSDNLWYPNARPQVRHGALPSFCEGCTPASGCLCHTLAVFIAISWLHYGERVSWWCLLHSNKPVPTLVLVWRGLAELYLGGSEYRL